ncbi:rhamnogalacturonate lyase B-like [Salvia splendens]|uniref:rhamnogalacturonate lyase B-like n=1 Tax=Salvia splendens TaxID=180675 RepID=UPI001C276222|nr:rhamnogalacturonate lyase B-like [Salvia splendens]
MPIANDRKRGRTLDFKEAVVLENPGNLALQGEVDDKYQYSCNTKDNRVHGWISSESKMLKEIKKWSYDFPASTDYVHAAQRGTITGRLLVRDNYLNRGKIIPAKSTYVGLAAPGYAGSWKRESKGYQFWTRTDETSSFTITSVRAGKYNLYAWVPTVLGDFKHEFNIVIKQGSKVELGDIVYTPPRNGSTLWEIGIADRTAAEFYIPDLDPTLVNKLFINHTDKYRQYGLWERYAHLYPDQDLTYIVGKSDYRKHLFFAHVNRKVKRGYKPTTWKIIFDTTNLTRGANYTLRLALASAQCANIQVWINDDPNGNLSHFETGRIVKDNAIARHGIHGLYWLYSIKVDGFNLVHGTNTIYLKQSLQFGAFNSVLYDYIRLKPTY